MTTQERLNSYVGMIERARRVSESSDRDYGLRAALARFLRARGLWSALEGLIDIGFFHRGTRA
jgi:hypothetical protein